ncbi:hypothetical protein SAMN05660642_03040 [Geodermatophilus siccatus]|uniref:Uncharacterized protein n=1 Tax=Geodermatophilus siccatus TaxID=1137991 RepID=A0A1G9V0U4_9ACTN|nr:hypothetical protein [Geodermatophilus siccatus]SDM65891.1 hypothetical protein SAMN05660642_03040 [Geodermatophilus siccatus]
MSAPRQPYDYERAKARGARQGEAIAVLLLVAAAAFAIGKGMSSREQSRDCTPQSAAFYLREGLEEDLQKLLDVGWRDDPNDGLEAIYPPGCLEG